mmetsp:Transcript_24032/g.44134  ORF Transcript_24032/g.44134 Transcript_24032/m.44134 type:complete len:155 (-) Transcript_24032:31-495(-)
MMKLQEVFNELDVTGDGELEWAELEAALNNKHMQAWLKSLDVDVHHMQDLFHLIDNGHGKITLSDFVEGVTRSKGNAKSIDILLLKRMLQTLEEKLSLLVPDAPIVGPTSPAGSGGIPKQNGCGPGRERENSGVVSHYSSVASGVSKGASQKLS